MSEPKPTEQLAGQYHLGEPLTEQKKGQFYVAVNKATGEMRQGAFRYDGRLSCHYTYYADPRPMPVLPEPPLVEWVAHNRYQLTAEGAARLERLLREEGE